MASSMGSVVVATTTSLMPRVRETRVVTRSNMVLSPIGNSTLPGRRVLDMRAWMMTTVFIDGSTFAGESLYPVRDAPHLVVGHPGEHRQG